EFGDGNTSTQTNPIHDYEEDGIYEVVLEATNVCGTDVFIVEIEIITVPTADFVASQEDGCDPFEVDFINYSSNNATSFFWSFQGGSPPTSTAFEPSIVYEIPGSFSVSLTAFNDAGEDTYTVSNYITVFPQPNSTFTASVEGLQATFNSAGSIGTSYTWNFGDCNTSNLQNPVHIYEEEGAYTVKLTVSNQCGSDIHTSIVTVIDAPVALFTSNVTEGCVPLAVQFINQSIGLVTSYSWVFEGGSPPTSSAPNPLVTYHNTGTFDVTLTVSNSVGSDVQVSNNYITVHPETFSDFDFEVNGTTVVFTNLSNSSTGSIWTFGDGLVSDDDNPVHTYDTDGTYTVILTSEGLCGTDTSSAVLVIATLPESDFSFTQSGSCIPAVVQFTNESSQNVISFAWSFPGGTPLTSNQENPLVTYNAAGTYDAQLIVFSTSGSDTLLINDAIIVGASPDAGFIFSTNGTTVVVENLSTNADTYEWQFGDGQFSIEMNPTHTYSEFGTYALSLIATNECGHDT
ncbi:MAG: PKD domain-containing protein, partial [Saprospiraceae bacterium]